MSEESVADAPVVVVPDEKTEEAAKDGGQQEQNEQKVENGRDSILKDLPKAAKEALAKQDAVMKLKVPEAFRDKGYMKNLMDANGEIDTEKVFKEIDGLQQLKGKKEIAFDFTNAKPEEIQAHFERIRPKEHTEYEVKGKVAEGTEEAIQKVLHESGLPKKQAEILVDKYIALEQKQMAELMSKEGFEKEMEASFGRQHQEKLGSIVKIAKQSLTENDLKILDGQPNVTMGMIYRLIDKLVSDYGITETGKAMGAGGSIVNESDAQKEVDTLFDQLIASKGKPNMEPNAHQNLVEKYHQAQLRLQKMQESKGGK